MKKLLSIVVLLILSTSLQVLAQETTLVSSKAETQAPQTWEDKNLDQPYIVLLNQQETQLNKDWSYQTINHYIMKIQKDSAKEMGEMPIYYNQSRETIDLIEAYVTNPTGERYPATKIQDLAVYQGSPMYSDFRVKIVTMPQVTVGSILDLRIKGKTISKHIKNQFWDAVVYPDVPTKVYKNYYIFPEGMDIAYKDYKKAEKPVITKDETQKQMIYTFEFRETEDVRDEPYSPPDHEVFGFSMFSSIKDWKDIAGWYRELINKNLVPDEKISQKVEELIKEAKTNEDRLRRILEYLQDHFRYVSMSFGDNTVEPHPVTEVFNNQYGDCKDWSILAKAMLKEAGIDSDICLFSGEYSGDPRHGLPNASAFDHVILQVMLDREKIFVDPLLKGYDLGQFPGSYQGANLLIISDENFRFETLPVFSEEQYSIVSDAEVTVSEDGSALYEIRTTWGNEISLPVKERWRATTDQEKEKFYNMLDENYTKGGEMLERRWEGMDERYGPLKSYLKFKRPNAYALLNNMIILNEKTESPPSEFPDKERKFPIFYPTNSLVKSTITYHIPEGFKVDFIPDDYKLENPVCEIAKSFKQEGNTLSATDIYRTKRALIEPEKYSQIKNLWKEAAQKNDKYIVLKKSEAAP